MSAFYFFIFLLGLCAGSFLNVIAFRYGTGEGMALSRSRCMHCGKTLSWFELIPIVSFLIQRGRCRDCRSRLSWQYPLVELFTAFVFVLVVWGTQLLNSATTEIFLASLVESLFYLIVLSILIVIAVYDARHKIIPDALVFSFIGLSILSSLIHFTYSKDWLLGIDHLLAGPLAALPFFTLWFFSKGRWMGFGDVKLALGIGFLLGIADGIYAILWSFWLGGLVSIVLITYSSIFFSSLSSQSRRFTMKSEIPFGPFMVLGTAVSLFLSWDFFEMLIQLIR
jgi:prepilin signal peptidase PulO-like enzyme (type II secretory pathway)